MSTTSTIGQLKPHTKRRQELGNAPGNQKAKQKRRKIAEVATSRGAEPRDTSKILSGTVERSQDGEQHNLTTKTFSATVERPQGSEQLHPAKTFGGNLGLPAGATARIQQSVGGINPYGYALGQLPEAIGQFALTYSHT